MSILDVKRTMDDFLKKKGKSSMCTLRNYGNIFKSLEKFCAIKYETGLENIIEDLAIIENPQEQVENLIQSYIDELEGMEKMYNAIKKEPFYQELRKLRDKTL